ncbi:phage virion morphogenesis protein [Brasilonema sp. CT11]|nr:phage virion morphogenesis protein [Brasilonema sp. CT11]
MAATFTVKINEKNLGNFRGLPDQIRNMRKPMQNALAYLEAETKKQFVSETDPEGRAWASLKPSTLARKKSGAIGRETSAMINSIFTRLTGDLQGEIGLSVEYALYFSEGTKKMAARPILGFNNTREAKVMSLFEIYIGDLVR